MYKIVKIENSPRKNKRFRVYLENNDYYDFGLLGASTYIEHHDKIKRENYRKRHMANNTEKRLIQNFIPSPALFSYYILWGDSTSVEENIKTLNKRLK